MLGLGVGVNVRVRVRVSYDGASQFGIEFAYQVGTGLRLGSVLAFAVRVRVECFARLGVGGLQSRSSSPLGI